MLVLIFDFFFFGCCCCCCCCCCCFGGVGGQFGDGCETLVRMDEREEVAVEAIFER